VGRAQSSFGKNIAKATEMGVPLYGAIVIGVDPIIAFSCQVQSSDATNDWFVAGGLRRSPAELTKAVGSGSRFRLIPNSSSSSPSMRTTSK
jgi:3-polyprenyl-4-hydroxybenzoate decarboxylase